MYYVCTIYVGRQVEGLNTILKYSDFNLSWLVIPTNCGPSGLALRETS
jgi:hypothetical protein